MFLSTVFLFISKKYGMINPENPQNEKKREQKWEQTKWKTVILKEWKESNASSMPP